MKLPQIMSCCCPHSKRQIAAGSVERCNEDGVCGEVRTVFMWGGGCGPKVDTPIKGECECLF